MPKGSRGNERHNYATRRLYDPHKNPGIREFRGVDGEGGNIPDPDSLFPELGVRHHYLSLRAGPDLLETGKPLRWWECLEFLGNLSPWYIYVSYFFDYDVTMMIRTFPRERAYRLLHRGLRTDPKSLQILPLDIVSPDGKQYQVDYLPHKEFKVRAAGHKKWVVISDTGQFFQGPFIDTLEKWGVGTQEERDFIRRSKAMRADFAEITEETRAYNAVECLTLEQLMTDFREVCKETGYVPKKWQGPGNLASAMLDHHRVPRRESIPILKNHEFRALAQAGYYGGRFETTLAGPVRGPVYQYDINGAYVHLLRSLPCLIHGTWSEVRNIPDQGRIWFGEIDFSHPEPRFLYNFPVRRRDGSIHFPREGLGVYWSSEVEAAQRCGSEVSFRRGWVYSTKCDCRWFDFVDDYYAERIRLGKSAKGYVLKLAGNSIYGKLAQSVGYAPWANPVWAGMITAGCRAMLIDAYSQCPDETWMLATDGIFCGKRLDLKISRNLGEWEETVHDDGIFVVQPGIYFMGATAKTRGVERGRIYGLRAIFEEQWGKYWESNGIDHTVSVPVDNFVTARLALQRNNWDSAGTWERTTRDISFDWSVKRKAGIAHWDGIHVRSVPYEGARDIRSVPYGRMIGGGYILQPGEQKYQDPGLVEAERMTEQPDWVEGLLSLSTCYLPVLDSLPSLGRMGSWKERSTADVPSVITSPGTSLQPHAVPTAESRHMRKVRVCKVCGSRVRRGRRGRYFHTGVPEFLGTLVRETELADIRLVRPAGKKGEPSGAAYTDIPFVPVRMEKVRHQQPAMALEGNRPPDVREDLQPGGSGTGRIPAPLPRLPAIIVTVTTRTGTGSTQDRLH